MIIMRREQELSRSSVQSTPLQPSDTLGNSINAERGFFLADIWRMQKAIQFWLPAKSEHFTPHTRYFQIYQQII